jgi:hypothetical protein
MYKRIPVDLVEGTVEGSIFSYVALAAMVGLFFIETGAFLFSKEYVAQGTVASFFPSPRLSLPTSLIFFLRTCADLWLTIGLM